MPFPFDVPPSSLRKAPATAPSADSNSSESNFVRRLASHAARPAQIAFGPARLAALSKSRFARLPQEPEDARITGVTRSLQRRLLALNLKPSSRPVVPAFSAKMA